jgi:hypothetical protein
MNECNCCGTRYIFEEGCETSVIYNALENECLVHVYSEVVPFLSMPDSKVFWNLLRDTKQFHKAVCEFCPKAVPRKHWFLLKCASQELNFVRKVVWYTILCLRRALSKDVATIIGKIIWGTRYDEAWKGKKLWDKSIDEKWSSRSCVFKYRGCSTGVKVCNSCGKNLVYGENVVAAADGTIIHESCANFSEPSTQRFLI